MSYNMVNPENNPELNSSEQCPEPRPLKERINEFIAWCQSTDMDDYASSPSLLEKTERIRQAFLIIHQGVCEIEDMQLDSETEDMQSSESRLGKQYLERLNSLMSCRPD